MCRRGGLGEAGGWRSGWQFGGLRTCSRARSLHPGRTLALLQAASHAAHARACAPPILGPPCRPHCTAVPQDLYELEGKEVNGYDAYRGAINFLAKTKRCGPTPHNACCTAHSAS
jgi:hypothetical protein